MCILEDSQLELVTLNLPIDFYHHIIIFSTLFPSHSSSLVDTTRALGTTELVRILL